MGEKTGTWRVWLTNSRCPDFAPPLHNVQPDTIVAGILRATKRGWNMCLEGIVINGVIVLDPEEKLPDGTRVEVKVKELPRAPSPLGEMLLRHAGKAVGMPEDMAEQHD